LFENGRIGDCCEEEVFEGEEANVKEEEEEGEDFEEESEVEHKRAETEKEEGSEEELELEVFGEDFSFASLGRLMANWSKPRGRRS
jgi:hypothetical protein